MTDDLVARLRSYNGAVWETTACYNGLREEAAANLEAAEARVRELEDRVGVLEHDLDAQIAGHRLSANEATKHLMRIRELEAELARGIRAGGHGRRR